MAAKPLTFTFEVSAHYIGKRFADGRPRIQISCREVDSIDCTLRVPVADLADHPIGSEYRADLYDMAGGDHGLDTPMAAHKAGTDAANRQAGERSNPYDAADTFHYHWLDGYRSAKSAPHNAD